MEEIKKRLAVCELKNDKIRQLSPATDEEIKTLQSYFSLPLPEELITFYKTIGGIESEDIFTIAHPKNTINWMQKQTEESQGLIDQIISFWSNDRYELQEFIFFTEEETEDINNALQCIGWISAREDQHQGAEFIVFDKNGNFMNLHSHQEFFEDFADEILGLLESGLPKRSLENVLEEVIERAEGKLSRW
ncbi:SMI1/KNR4 family protein [Flavobacterium sp.]|uniref:SMI1/KNR4 family protein n=1 Tax=Flavobacterium sp. TaxID=239 RepID=UPI0031D0E159